MRINQNIMAFNAYRNLSSTQNTLGKSLEKLSSGYRINRAADDAAGLVKSEGLRAEIKGANQAIRNAQDAVSLVQTAEGALNEVHSILQRMRELTVSAANTATSDGAAEQVEIDELAREITAIGSRTKFSGDDAFQAAARTFRIGASNGDTLAVTIGTLSAGGLGVGALNVGTGAAPAIDTIDTAIGTVSTTRSTLGATQTRLEHTISNLQVTAENLSASESRIRDTDLAQEMVEFTGRRVRPWSGTSTRVDVDRMPRAVLSPPR